MRVKANKLLIIMLLIFPVSTITGSIPLIGTVTNKALFFVIIALLIFGLIKSSLTRMEWIVLILLVVVYAYDCFVTDWPLYNSNELFYLATWVIFLMYCKKKYEFIKVQLIKNIKLIKIMVILWEAIVLVGFAVPSCYGKLHTFSAFTSSPHRMDSSALMILALLLLVYRYSNYKKRVWFFLLIPSIAIILSAVRTYLILLGLILIVFYYFANHEHPQRFYFTVIPIVIIAVIVVAGTDIMQHRMDLIEEDAKYFDSQGYNAWTAITSGRSTFWLIDLYHYWMSPWLNRILGNGFNFVRYVNGHYYTTPIWAHNDFINIICCNGVIGLFLYFYSYISTAHSVIKKYKQPIMLIVGFHLICMLNAMFNMLYTYFAATLAIPFFLIAIFDREYLPFKKQRIVKKHIVVSNNKS